MMEAVRESGGAEAAKPALSTFAGNVAGLSDGSGAANKKFRRWGISTMSDTGRALTGEQIYVNFLKRMDATSNAAVKAALAQDFLGDSYKKFMRTIEEGADGYVAAKEKNKKYMPSAGGLASVENVGNTGLGIMSTAGHLFMKGYAAYVDNPLFNLWTGSRDLQRAIDDPGVANAQARLDAASKKPGWTPHKKSALEIKAENDAIDLINPDARGELLKAQYAAGAAHAEFDDIGKESISDLAEKGRKFTGQPHRRNYSMTPRMRIALHIQDLEEQAAVANERGDDSGRAKFAKQAEDLKTANQSWLQYAEGHKQEKCSRTSQARTRI